MHSNEGQNDMKNQRNQEENMSRRERRKARKEEKRKRRKPRRRIFPIWLRIIFVILGCIAAVLGGVMVGYGVLGEGVPEDALKKETWQHIIDIITKRE